jgi:hypothetical protein
MAGERGNLDEKRIEATADALVANYIDAQYHYVQFLTEHLADCAAAFEGDLATVLVLAVLGQRRLEVLRESPGAPAAEVSRTAMSAMRIADVAGIPRETVRRKLEVLRRMGWIDQDPRHGWYIVSRSDKPLVRAALSDLEARSFRRLARLFVRLAEILDRSA